MAQGYDEDRRKGLCCCHFGSGCCGRRGDDWNARGKAQLAQSFVCTRQVSILCPRQVSVYLCPECLGDWVHIANGRWKSGDCIEILDCTPCQTKSEGERYLGTWSVFACKASVDRHPFPCLSTQPIYPMETEDAENGKESRENKTRIGFNEDSQSSQHSHVRVYFGCLFCQTNREQQWDSSEPVGSGAVPPCW